MSEENFESHLTGAIVKEFIVDEDTMYEVIYRDQVVLVDPFKVKAILTSINQEECDRLYQEVTDNIRQYQKQA